MSAREPAPNDGTGSPLPVTGTFVDYEGDGPSSLVFYLGAQAALAGGLGGAFGALVGVLAAVLDVVRRFGLNVEDMNNTIFAGAKAAVAVLRLSAAPPDALIEEIARMDDKVIQVSAKPC